MMSKHYFDLSSAHPSWHPCLRQALEQMDTHYLEKLLSTQSWLPGPEKIFAAFSLPVNKVNYLLLGESPYPRAASANGYAFWDAQVGELWSAEGMSKKVNRATSLRNLMKMLLVSEGLLRPPSLTQPDIVKIDKSRLIKTNDELFSKLLEQGFLLLNATLVLHPASKSVKKDAQAWLPFLRQVISFLLAERPNLKFILFGRIANTVEKLLPPKKLNKLCVEHPYNHSFITNPQVLAFFKPFKLLSSSAQTSARVGRSKD